MAAGDVQCRLLWTGNPGQGYAYNIFHLNLTSGAVDQSFADDIAAALANAFTGTDWHLTVANNVFMDTVFVRELTTPPGAEFISLINEVGASTEDQLSAQNALVTSLTTGQPGRSGRGRIYNAGLTADALTGSGDAQGATALGINAGWAAFNAEMQTLGSGELEVYSKKLDTGYVVTGLATDTKFDVQRRRAR